MSSSIHYSLRVTGRRPALLPLSGVAASLPYGVMIWLIPIPRVRPDVADGQRALGLGCLQRGPCGCGWACCGAP